MGISYTLFWEKRQYWRVFTASFSHFELWHLAMNTLSTYNSRGIEQRLGTFRFLCLVRIALRARWFRLWSRLLKTSGSTGTGMLRLCLRLLGCRVAHAQSV